MGLVLNISLVILIVLQIIVLIQLLYTNHKRYKKDKEFWTKMAEQEETLKEELNILKNMEYNQCAQNTLEDKENGNR